MNELLAALQAGGGVASIALCAMMWRLDRRLVRMESRQEVFERVVLDLVAKLAERERRGAR